MNNLYITGFMSSGKSVISKELAKITGKPVFDTDIMIEEKLHMKITDIFTKFGEEYFRNAETEILEQVSKYDNSIVSTGGGMILREANREIMKNTGVVIALIPGFEIIEKRLDVARRTRPLLKDETENIKKRYMSRLPFYEDCHIAVRNGFEETPAQIAHNIVGLVEEML